MGANGFCGSQGAPGPRGDQGETGPKGLQTNIEIFGEPGEKGLAGNLFYSIEYHSLVLKLVFIVLHSLSEWLAEFTTLTCKH